MRERKAVRLDIVKVRYLDLQLDISRRQLDIKV